MTTIQGFRAVFDREIDSYLAKMSQKASEASRCSLQHGGMDSTMVSQHSASVLDDEQLDNLRRLAQDMTDNVLKRLADHASFWGLEEDSGHQTKPISEAESEAMQAAESCASSSEAEARCQALEAELARLKQEEDDLQQEVTAKFKAKHQAVLDANEQELAAKRQKVEMFQASLDSPCGSDDDSSQVIELQQDIAESAKRMSENINTAKQVIADIQRIKQEVENAKKQQSRSLNPVDRMLAGKTATLARDSEEPQTLEDALYHGEKVLSRMKLHLDDES